MKLALDYDGTFTADPDLWMRFINTAHERGHQVSIVTMRYPEEPIIDALATLVGQRVHYTERKGKMAYATNRGVVFDVWIDDFPIFIFNDAADARPPSERLQQRD